MKKIGREVLRLALAPVMILVLMLFSPIFYVWLLIAILTLLLKLWLGMTLGVTLMLIGLVILFFFMASDSILGLIFSYFDLEYDRQDQIFEKTTNTLLFGGGLIYIVGATLSVAKFLAHQNLL